MFPRDLCYTTSLLFPLFSPFTLHPLHPLIAPKPRSREAAARKMISRDFPLFERTWSRRRRFLSLALLSSLPPAPRSCVFLQSVFPFNAPLLSAFPLCVRAQRLFYTRRDVSLRVKARALALAREKCNKRLGVFSHSLTVIRRRERELFLFTPLTFAK